MVKKIAILVLMIGCLFIMGCHNNIYQEEKNDNDQIIEVKQKENTKDNNYEKKSEVDVDINDQSDTFFSDNQYVYNVDSFLEEDLTEVMVNVAEVATYEYGNVYSIIIDYDDCEGRYFWGVTDRFNLGMFYVTDDNIYWLSDAKEELTEEDFESEGIIIYSNESSEQNIDGQEVTINNTDDVCRCVISNTLTESGFYSIFEWSKDKKLNYYSSGYGAGGDLIELEFDCKN